MRKKKFVKGFLALSLSASVLAACSNDKASTEGKAASGGTTKDGKVQLTALITKHPLTQDLSKMEWLKEAEKRAGVEIKWQQVTADWGQKKGTLLASGDIPDLIVGPNAITDADYVQYNGLFEDLSDDMKSLPNVEKMFEEKPETKGIATQLDGNIYGLPKYQRFWPGTATRMFINQKWLDKVGMKMPTTWDELYDVLVAFKEKDPNGNGKQDEIPMDFGANYAGFFTPSMLLGSEGITLTDAAPFGYFVENGKVKNYLQDERYKKLIEFLHKCYAAGLINKEVFTQDYTKFQSVARGTGDVAKVGFSWGWEVTDRFGNQLAPQYTSMPQLKVSADSTAKLSWDYDYNALNYGANMVSVSAKSQHKDAVLKFINELYDPKVSMQVLFGSLGTNIADNGDGTYKVLQPQDSKMDPGTWKWTSTWADNGPMYISDDLKLTLGTDMQSVGKQTEPLDPVLNSIDKNKDLLPSMFMKYSKEDNSKLSLNNTNLDTLAKAKFSQWITKGGIEKEWDSYLKNVKKTGLEENLKIMQKNYDKYMSSQK
ncbi:ABC transporter substrate-binding protein [Bacillus sp. AFS076308]|uniref:extracellular solute-binding protein n=1 Tax=unclassified Bacillus (in: firmicutes) TaxID=185979 RepID=UPI000BF66030|nr:MULTISPECIES: extracellular solute-binding protein [unclassified Bacillus (in: firmicutes)]PFN97309.1 ABC transporter substrate-binding protein [Bacillus sp. AFS076308]PGV51739.1 ABC transporter substrate-binding protein [Bacillus sp. AFS037270]